jgi:hypothetical protein
MQQVQILRVRPVMQYDRDWPLGFNKLPEPSRIEAMPGNKSEARYGNDLLNATVRDQPTKVRIAKIFLPH